MLGQSRWLLRGDAAMETVVVGMGRGGLWFVLQDDREAFSAPLHDDGARHLHSSLGVGSEGVGHQTCQDQTCQAQTFTWTPGSRRWNDLRTALGDKIRQKKFGDRVSRDKDARSHPRSERS